MTILELKKLCDREIQRGNGSRLIYYVDKSNKDEKQKTYRSVKYGFTEVEVVTNTKDFVTLT